MKKRGIGVGSMWYGVANTAMSNPAGAVVDLLDDGTVIILTGCADIGQGSDTILAQIAAEAIGCRYEDVDVSSFDTSVSPDAGASSASRQTYISGNAVRLASEQIRDMLLPVAARMADKPPESITIENSQVLSAGEHTGISLAQVIGACKAAGMILNASSSFNPDAGVLDPADGSGKPYATYAFATQIAEVEVDTDTGLISVLNVIAAHDVGKAINPQSVAGQIEGGCGMGLSYGIFEELQVNKGKIQNASLSSYILPTAMDAPEVYPIIVEAAEATGPYGAKGVGEPALIPTAAAILNAVYDAIGIRFYELPLSPERVMEGLKARRTEVSN